MTRVREWYEDHENLAALLQFLDDRCELRDVPAAIYVIEKPWKWTPEWLELEAQRAQEALPA